MLQDKVPFATHERDKKVGEKELGIEGLERGVHVGDRER